MDIKKLAQAIKGTEIYDFLDNVKLSVADVRNKINVKSEIEIEVRKAVCEVIDEMIIMRLKTTDESKQITNDNWN